MPFKDTAAQHHRVDIKDFFFGVIKMLLRGRHGVGDKINPLGAFLSAKIAA